MCATVAKTEYTPDDLLRLPDDKNYELVDGQLVERHMGTASSWVGGQIYGLLWAFCQSAKPGWLMPSDTSFQCFADARKVRRPDVSFVRYGRFPHEQLPVGHCRLPPDLVVEVLSPNDLAYEIDQKVREYLAASVPLVWVVNPETRTVTIYRADRSIAGLEGHDELSGEDILPGFRCSVAELFPPIVAPNTTP